MSYTAALQLNPESTALFESPRVYSYTRFSTPEQAQGDSLRRQSDGALRWTERKSAERARDGLPPLALDDKLRMQDLGVSAFRGKNVGEGGELGAFLTVCRQGLVPAGSYLLVESLDRVSRMTPRKVQRILDDIVDAGVTIVTLSDGQEYDEERMNNDPTALLIALMVSWRAHEESKVKGQRLSAAWAEKRRRVREGLDTVLTSKGPSWLQRTPEGWAERAPHADTVRRIYRMTLDGVGEHAIAAALNTEKVPVMGRGKMWHRSTIGKLLRFPAVIGTLVPGRMDHSGGKALRRLEEAIPNAFPAVVSEADWIAVRVLKDGTAPGVRGRGATAPLSNVFASLARCPECGAAMTRVFKGSGPKGGRPKLVCTRAKTGAAEHAYRSVDLDTVHGAFYRHWHALVADIPAGEAGGHLDDAFRDLSAAIDAAVDDLQALDESYRRRPSTVLASRMRAVEGAIRSYRADLGQLDQQRTLADHGLVVTRVGLLADAMEPEDESVPNVGKVNAALRTLFDGVTVDYRTGFLRFHWRQGGETEVMFAWVDNPA
jgi:DNA invertase Pin-like site-specific DNA recombinase